MYSKNKLKQASFRQSARSKGSGLIPSFCLHVTLCLFACVWHSGVKHLLSYWFMKRVATHSVRRENEQKCLQNWFSCTVIPIIIEFIIGISCAMLNIRHEWRSQSFGKRSIRSWNAPFARMDTKQRLQMSVHSSLRWRSRSFVGLFAVLQLLRTEISHSLAARRARITIGIAK